MEKHTIAKLKTAIELINLFLAQNFLNQSLMLTNERQKQSAIRSSKQYLFGIASLRKKSRRGNDC